MLKKILPVLFIATSSAAGALAASAPATVPAGAALRPEMCFSWRLSAGLLPICLGEMRNAATDAERQAVARRFSPDYRPPGSNGDYQMPPRNAAVTQKP